jgi:hypothetical protein
LSLEEPARVGEVVEASTTEFIAQCYELYQIPPLGSLVKTRDLPLELYGIVGHATTTSLEPGRRPIARGKNEDNEEAIYRSSPQLNQLLKSEFHVLVVGHRSGDRVYHYLPPQPARIHSFVYLCPPDEARDFSQSFGFLNILLNANLPLAADELIAAALRQMSQIHPDRHTFLVTAGKELAILLAGQLNRLNAVLWRIKE